MHRGARYGRANDLEITATVNSLVMEKSLIPWSDFSLSPPDQGKAFYQVIKQPKKD